MTSDNKKSHPSLRSDVVNKKNEPDTPIWPTRYLQTKQGDRYHEYISPAHDRCTDLEQAAAAAAVDASFKSWRSCDNDSDVVERASSSLKQPSKYYGIEEQCPKESNGSAATPVNPHHPSETDIPASTSTPSGEESAVDPTILPALLYAAGAQPASVRAYRRCSEDRSLMGRQAIRDHLYDSPSTSRLPRSCLGRLFPGSSDSTVKDFPCCNATSVARLSEERDSDATNIGLGYVDNASLETDDAGVFRSNSGNAARPVGVGEITQNTKASGTIGAMLGQPTEKANPVSVVTPVKDTTSSIAREGELLYCATLRGTVHESENKFVPTTKIFSAPDILLPHH